MSDADSDQSSNDNYGFALVSLTSLFFMWGLITSLNDVLIPRLKAVFDLSYTEAMMIQFCFFFAYTLRLFLTGLGCSLVSLLVRVLPCWSVSEAHSSHVLRAGECRLALPLSWGRAGGIHYVECEIVFLYPDRMYCN